MIAPMNLKKRYLSDQVEQDLMAKMVFVGGPRQVGKTTLAKSLLGPDKAGYLNWDIAQDRERILRHELPDVPFWAFDEIHKYKSWRSYLKGVYDQFGRSKKIVVTGSAKLNLYRRGGDSLQGRYHYLRLHPLSVAELRIDTKGDFDDLLELGGFPEPFFLGKAIEAKRWSREYRQRLIQDDLTALESIRDLGNLELLMLRLPDLVGSPLSVNALREDLGVSHKTVAHWLDVFANLYAIFRVSPFGSPSIRAVKKEQKHYHFDWTLVTDPGARFENMVACHLLKWVQFEQDTKARELELRYFRDIDGREVDFVVTDNGKPIYAIECKSGIKDINPALRYFKAKFPDCTAWQVSATEGSAYINRDGVKYSHALELLKGLV